MNIFGLNISRKVLAVEDVIIPSGAQISDVNPQGPLTGIYQNYIFRKVSGDFYEKLRESIPIIDAGIRRLISLNGTIKIIGDNAGCVRELEDFCQNVPVNDMQKGIHSFLENSANEVFEQGFAISEFVATPDLKDIAGLRVADSKQLIFRRDKAGRSEPWYIYPLNYQQQQQYSFPADLIDKLMNASYESTIIYGSNFNLIKLGMANKLYFSINNENTNPYGISMLRSMEFVSQILATLQNSVKSVAERFGDPMYHAHYKAGKSGGDLETRRKKLEDDFFAIISAKRQGHSGDLVTAGGPDSDVLIKVIGHEGQIMQYDVPLKHVLEQIVSKFNLPAWMLGLYWNTIGSKGSVEVECALQDAKIRQFAMLPEFIRLFSTVLNLRGRKWSTITTAVDKPGDWGIVFETPNVRDMVAQAQARFLNAQADQMQLIAGTQPVQTSLSIGAASMEIEGMKFQIAQQCGCKTPHSALRTPHSKELMRPIPWPELDKVEADYETELKFDWQELLGKVFLILGLADNAKTTKAPGDIPPIDAFKFTAEQRQAVMKALENYLGYYDPTDPNSSVRWYYGQAYSLGLIQAVQLLGKDRPVLDIIKNKEIFDELARNGFQLVTDNATMAIVDEIIPAMEAMMLNGDNPVNVAFKLSGLFGDQNSDWERLARSEMAMAAESAKIDEWQAWDVKRVKFSPAPDACPLCFSLAGDYEISAAPLPVDDTHPRCRCTVIPAASEVNA